MRFAFPFRVAGRRKATRLRTAPPPHNVRDEEDSDLPPGGRRPARPARPLRFALRVKTDPDRKLKGAYSAEATPDGCRLRRGKKFEVLLPPGTYAEYRDGNCIDLEIEGRVVEFRVVKPGAYQKRLARDLAAFLGEKDRELRPKDYTLEWYLLVPALLPLGVPVLTLGGGLPLLIGFGATAISFAVAQVENWPIRIRALCCWGIAVCAYLALAVLILVVVVAQLARQAPPAPAPVVPRAVPAPVNPNPGQGQPPVVWPPRGAGAPPGR